MYQIAYKRDVLLPKTYATFEEATQELEKLIEVTKGYYKRFNPLDYEIFKVAERYEKNCNKEV